MDFSEPGYVVSCRKSQKHKAENKVMFEQIDAQLPEEHPAVAEGWAQ